ncbi:alpha/beta fold hydrolase [Streptomyces sp. NPDC004667]|uniref:alpha/beta hydrolase family protein n=1 Tax=Streptomyces sp. NPDC004667 TaxID=3154285 RepID=UPI0033A67E15
MRRAPAAAADTATATATASAVAAVAEERFSRATGAGLDPHEYRWVTAGPALADGWAEAFAAMGRRHLARAERAASALSEGGHLQVAARWFHFATLGPDPRGRAQARAAGEADAAMGRALALLEPGARRIEGPSFAGWLRGPADAAATVVVVPGLDSGKEEFHAVTRALLDRGLTVFAMDGPGQGVLAPHSTLRPDYERVVAGVVDALGVDRVGLIGLSLGGWYAARSAALEPRVAAVATVSGPLRLDWDGLPPVLRELLARRVGGAERARAFTGRVDLSGVAPDIACPLLVVDGGRDVIPGVVNGAGLAALAPRGEYLLVPHGEHLLGNAHPHWLARTADWLAEALTAPGRP